MKDFTIFKIDLRKKYMFVKAIATNNVMNGDIAFAVCYVYLY